MEGKPGQLGRAIRCGRRIVETAGRSLFPHFCLVCGEEGRLICRDCWVNSENALKMGIFWCPGCGRENGSGRVCGPGCRDKSGLDAAIAMLPYSRQLTQRLLQLWKYHSVEEAGELLLRLFGEWLSAERNRLPEWKGCAFVPVPLHPLRLAQRGFNQASMIAVTAASVTGGTAYPKFLKRHWQWKKQAKISDDGKRRQNAAGSVGLSTVGQVPQRIVLVDDVMTTGATLRTCAELLRRAGCQVISAVTILRG